MDDDGDVDSQSELVGSLSCWMMKNLSQHATTPTKPSDKLSLSLPDTVLLQDGHLFHWLFSKSGMIVQRANKRLEWDGFVKFLVRCARDGKGGKKARDSWESSSDDVIATARRLKGGRTYPVMLTARDMRSLREKHNAHLLDEIVAIQPLVAKNPFTGCGLFETEFRRKGRKRSAQAALATHELARWPEEDVKWFDESGPTLFVNGSFTGSGGARGDETFSQFCRGRDSTATKRVHGIIHRLLATTTKKVVEHIERVTEETILKVVAQFAFRPGSGQPTLLWLDSVHTVRSTQLLSEHTADPNSEFMQLTRDLGEGSCRSWTTFFPPKMEEINRGGGSAVPLGTSASAESQRSEFLRRRTKQLTFRAGVESAGGGGGGGGKGSAVEGNGRLDEKTRNIEWRGEANVAGGSTSPLSTAARGAAVAGRMATSGIGTAIGVTPAREGFDLEEPRRVNEEVDDRSSCSCSGDQGRDYPRRQGGHFTLPTEASARRSAGSRGHYFSGTGEAGTGETRPEEEGAEEAGVTMEPGKHADQSLQIRWPRKRSTGTTMRLDNPRGRVDLRSAAENRRPWTSLMGQASERVGAGVVAESASGTGDAGNISYRLTSANGCYGDYCHYAGTWSSSSSSSSLHRGGSGGGSRNPPDNGGRGENEPENDTAAAVSKLVSYRSIIKSRAEESLLLPLSQRPSSTPSSWRLKAKTDTGNGGCRREFQQLPTLGDTGGRHRKRTGKNDIDLASLIAERMRLLAASLSDQGGGEYFSLASSDRATAGAPEVVQHAVEELLYEKFLSHLHPTTVSRAVPVCDTCALVYTCMDTYRRQTKQAKAAARETTRAARVELARQRTRRRGRPKTPNPEQDNHAAALRRYSDLNLGGFSPAQARPATSDGVSGLSSMPTAKSGLDHHRSRGRWQARERRRAEESGRRGEGGPPKPRTTPVPAFLV